MAEFIPAAKGSFLDRFKRRYSAQEVDMYQKGAANDYGQTFRMVEREFRTALDSDVVPEDFNGDVDAWNQFRVEQKNKPATFFPDMTDVYKVLGKDTTNRFFAGSDLGSKLLDNPDDPETQKKNVNLAKTEEFVDPETGETRYAPAVDTYNVGEGGGVSGRTNEITDDGKPQNETQKFGFNNLDKDEFNAMVETIRLAKLKEGGIYSEGFVQGDPLFRALSTDLDAALVGDRSKVVDTVKKVETLKKGLKDRGFNIMDPEQVEQSNAAANQASAEAMPNLEGTFSGAIVNPANPAVVKAKEIVDSYQRGDNVNVEELAMGLSKGFRFGFKRDFNSSQTRIDAAKVRIAALEKKKQENNGTLSKGDQQKLVGAERQLKNGISAQERSIDKVRTNIENDTARYQKQVGGNLEQHRERLDNATFSLTVEGLSPTGRARAFTEQGTALTKFLTSKHIETLGQDKVFVNQVLSAEPKSLKAIQKNPVLMEDLKNLSGAELNSKYLNSDGSVNEKLVYGSKLSKEAGDVLTKNISNKKVDELFTAINNGNQEKVQSILASVNISDEDQQKLLTEVQSTGGDYRSEGNVNKLRKLYFATISSLVPGSVLFNTLTNPDNSISNMIETGMINDEGVKLLKDRQGMASTALTTALKPFDEAFKTFNGVFETYQNPEKDTFNDWSNYQGSLGTALRRMRSEAAAFGRNPPAQVTRQLVQAETALAREIIKNEGKAGVFMKLVTLGFASDPAPDAFGNNIDVGIVPATATSPDKVRKIVASNGKQMSIGELKSEYGDELAAVLISLAYFGNKSKAGN